MDTLIMTHVKDLQIPACTPNGLLYCYKRNIINQHELLDLGFVRQLFPFITDLFSRLTRESPSAMWVAL
jgi:hypothetical protein